MGEVYRARDTKLGRDVALKVLPDSLAHDPDRLARFEREAHLLAALNHPNIAHIHGFEDSTGVPALVMELVDGPTLADRVAGGPIPLDEALPIAKQIAEALEAAHEQGIIHRDLKPANIKVRVDGTVKVLDFGLAKAFDPTAASSTSATMSPTLSVHATQTGIILGTAAYMAPEQARGKSVDKRADIWAFGCVLYEMLSGRRPFDGDDVSITLAAVMMKEPDWAALPSDMPVGVRRLLTRCLKKDPKERLRDIGDARAELGEFLNGPREVITPPIVPASPLRRHGVAVAVVLITGAMTGAFGWIVARSTLARPRISRLEITMSDGASFSINGLGRDISITPDGSRLVYVGSNATTLFVRPLDQLEATPLVHDAGLRDPFMSPDGQWVGFFDGSNVLKKVAITGGPAVLVARINGDERGATWAADGTIIFATAASSTGLQRVSADGGTPTVLTRPDLKLGEAGHIWPELLPGGQAVLCTVTATTGGLDAASLAILDLRSGRLTILLRGGSHAQYSPSGHLVYGAAGTLRAVGFDLTHRIVTGTPSQVVPHLRSTGGGAVEAVLAHDGTLVYVAGGAGRSRERTLVWVDRQGRETPLAAPPRAYYHPRISPDGSRVAVTAADQDLDIWLWDLARAVLTRITTDPATDAYPVWRRDGRRLVFGSNRVGGVQNLFSQTADGTGAVDRLTESPNPQVPSAVSPDDTQVVFTEYSSKTGADVMALALDGTHQVFTLVQTPFDERHGIVSPDGRWLAYEANDSGPFEIHVRPFPDVNRGHWQVSTAGGTQPLWASGGRELFYLAPDGALMRVAVGGGPAWTAGSPMKVLEGRYVVGPGTALRNYDIGPDGQRFLMIKASAGGAIATPPQIIVVQHFDEELKRLLPTK
jgi:serine/threonine-protein kinase